ncbi:MAG: DUF6732 family protein [Hoeflea sp.]|uniref:DUF6732 family protein n=1 Tax=Hoeflea sp. TaxID=1940281 RepID=UPI003EF13518
MRTLLLSLILSVSSAHVALAHGGHIGDLAGHSHWVGWAAAAAAGAITAWAIKRGNKSKTAGQEETDEADTDKQPEAAEA